jgi:hypothetical protein
MRPGPWIVAWVMRNWLTSTRQARAALGLVSRFIASRFAGTARREPYSSSDSRSQGWIAFSLWHIVFVRPNQAFTMAERLGQPLCVCKFFPRGPAWSTNDLACSRRLDIARYFHTMQASGRAGKLSVISSVTEG